MCVLFLRRSYEMFEATRYLRYVVVGDTSVRRLNRYASDFLSAYIVPGSCRRFQSNSSSSRPHSR